MPTAYSPGSGPFSPFAYPSLVATMMPQHARDNIGVPTTNHGKGGRVVIPKSGMLRDLSCYINASAGNYDIAVYSCAAPRVRLWSKGSTAVPAVGWQILGDPNLAVVKGDMLDLIIALSDTATARISGFAGSPTGALPAGFLDGVAALPKLYFLIGTAVLPLPANIAEVDVSGSTGTSVLIIGRIS